MNQPDDHQQPETGSAVTKNDSPEPQVAPEGTSSAVPKTDQLKEASRRLPAGSRIVLVEWL